jgi:Zn-dependent protease with chaperone function
MMRNTVVLILLLAFLSGCATITGPSVSEEEINRASDELRVKALGFQLKQLQRVNDIGYRLIAALPKEDLKNKPQSYVGLYVFDIDKYLKKLYNLVDNQGCVVTVVINNSPAAKSGVRPGDVLLSLNDIPIDNAKNFYSPIRKLNISDKVKLRMSRSGRIETVYLTVDSIPLNIPIVMVDYQEVNAAASSEGIFITYGLIQFARSDDEIAAVLGHELAHIVRGHLSKAQGTQLLSMLAALALSLVTQDSSEEVSSAVAEGAGNLVQLFSSSYSRDLEREADYFGTKYVYLAGFNVDVCATFEERFAVEIPQSMIRSYLSTHPSSPERMLRIKKAIAELKSQKKLPPR